VCRRPALRPRQDRGVRPLRRPGMVPAQSTTRTPTTDFRGSIPRLGTRCLRLAAWVTPLPRKTRFRSLARRFRTGFHPQGSDERFPSLRLHLILLSQACVTQASFGNSMLTRGRRTSCAPSPCTAVLYAVARVYADAKEPRRRAESAAANSTSITSRPIVSARGEAIIADPMLPSFARADGQGDATKPHTRRCGVKCLELRPNPAAGNEYDGPVIRPLTRSHGPV
jgi:hypothetical protein